MTNKLETDKNVIITRAGCGSQSGERSFFDVPAAFPAHSSIMSQDPLKKGADDSCCGNEVRSLDRPATLYSRCVGH
jgi:hypothetical protein